MSQQASTGMRVRVPVLITSNAARNLPKCCKMPRPARRDLGLGDGRTNYEGLLLIFQRAANGYSCKQIAEEMNSFGYRTTGNRGSNLFTKDTVTVILRSRFYLGELPDGEYKEG